MRHNHKNYIVSPCKSVFDLLLNWKNQKKHIGDQNPKNRFIFAKKPKTRC